MQRIQECPKYLTQWSLTRCAQNLNKRSTIICSKNPFARMLKTCYYSNKCRRSRSRCNNNYNSNRCIRRCKEVIRSISRIAVFRRFPGWHLHKEATLTASRFHLAKAPTTEHQIRIAERRAARLSNCNGHSKSCIRPRQTVRTMKLPRVRDDNCFQRINRLMIITTKMTL